MEPNAQNPSLNNSTQNLPDPQHTPQSQGDQQQPVIQPPSKSPEEAPVTYETYVPEIQKSAEVQKSGEIPKPVVETPQPNAPKPQTQLSGSSPNTTAEDLNVVDRTSEITSLHDIKKPRDKITDRADEEETDFIEKVEAAHGHK